MIQGEQDFVGVDNGYPGGPRDTSILTEYGNHVANRLWNKEDRGPLRVFSHGKKLRDVVIKHPEVLAYVKNSGLLPLMDCTHKMIDKELVSAFVERWHTETNSFHLPIGEMTITLEDVSSLLHIPVTGAFFTFNFDGKRKLARLLEKTLEVSYKDAFVELGKARNTSVRLKWLIHVYHKRCREGRYEQAARAILLLILGCTLFPDKSSHGVPVAYMEFFQDLHNCGGFAWGAAALAYLFQCLRDASIYDTKGLCGCLTLLQAWIYVYFPRLGIEFRSQNPTYTIDKPLACKWDPKKSAFVLPFRRALDEITLNDVCWTPYDDHHPHWPFQQISLYRGWIRWDKSMFAHLPDRVLRQYGHLQSIPPSPHDITRKVTTPKEIDHMFSRFESRIIDVGPRVVQPGECVPGYNEWFMMISHPFLIPPEPAPAPVPAPVPALVAAPPPPLNLVLSDGLPIVQSVIDHVNGGSMVNVRRREDGSSMNNDRTNNSHEVQPNEVESQNFDEGIIQLDSCDQEMWKSLLTEMKEKFCDLTSMDGLMEEQFGEELGLDRSVNAMLPQLIQLPFLLLWFKRRFCDYRKEKEGHDREITELRNKLSVQEKEKENCVDEICVLRKKCYDYEKELEKLRLEKCDWMARESDLDNGIVKKLKAENEELKAQVSLQYQAGVDNAVKQVLSSISQLKP